MGWDAKAAGVVHTVGTLMENDLYKKALRRSNPAQYNGANYELVNRDAALRVAETVRVSPSQPLHAIHWMYAHTVHM